VEQQRTTGSPVPALLRSAHAGPALAVTAVAGLLAVTAGLPPSTTALVVASVLTGQLSIGWSNDLVDVRRDRAVHRADKPLATGEVGVGVVRVACALALAATVPLSLACGLVAGLVHLLTVGSGWAYNLGLKSTAWSWLPYAVAFGALPVFVTLAGAPGELPPAWVPLAGALLGVGAHLVNALPDLDDDAATGVHGLPHRIGARRTGPAATAALVAASVLIALSATGSHRWLSWLGLPLVVVLAAVGLRGRGRTPFRAAVAIALLDVALLAGAR
jgi:4-hydroxybenzoate polyprenyltransferase